MRSAFEVSGGVLRARLPRNWETPAYAEKGASHDEVDALTREHRGPEAVRRCAQLSETGCELQHRCRRRFDSSCDPVVELRPEFHERRVEVVRFHGPYGPGCLRRTQESVLPAIRGKMGQSPRGTRAHCRRCREHDQAEQAAVVVRYRRVSAPADSVRHRGRGCAPPDALETPEGRGRAEKDEDQLRETDERRVRGLMSRERVRERVQFRCATQQGAGFSRPSQNWRTMDGGASSQKAEPAMKTRPPRADRYANVRLGSSKKRVPSGVTTWGERKKSARAPGTVSPELPPERETCRRILTLLQGARVRVRLGARGFWARSVRARKARARRTELCAPTRVVRN